MNNAITLSNAELKPALTGLGKVINKHSALPVLDTVKIERTGGGRVALTATDLDRFVTVRLEVPSEGQPFSVLVPFEELLKTSKACGKEDLILVERGSRNATTAVKYAIGRQMVEREVEAPSVEEFPEIPKIEGTCVAIDGGLRSSIHDAMDCASTDETRLVLNGAYIDVSDDKCHCVVGTDGRHLYSSNSFSLPLEKSLIVPCHKFLDWKEFNNDGDWKLKTGTAADDDSPPPFQISSQRWTFISRQIQGNYPHWRQVIPGPGSCQTSFEFDMLNLETVIRTIQRMPCNDAADFAIGLELNGTRVSLLGRSPNAEKFTRVEIQTLKAPGKSVTVFLNRNYLTKALRFGLNQVEIIDPLSPLKFRSGGRQMVVMPVRTGATPESMGTAAEPAEDAETGTEAETSTTEPAETKNEEPEPAEPIEKAPMVNTTTTETPAATVESRIEETLTLLDSLKESLQDGLAGLKELSSRLKLIQREHKASEREMQTIRSTVRMLRNVKV